MPLGIKPTVDFAFKKIFGSPQNALALVGLLNAILKLPKPIESVEILNPFNYQEFADCKSIVLDVRCRDADGRLLNVEMQISVHSGLLSRLVFYACNMYSEQLGKGDSYTSASPAISICLLNQRVFPDSKQAHHRFRMVDQGSGRELDNAIEVHTVELTKYNLNERSIPTVHKLEQWIFLILRAQDYESEALKKLLPGKEFQQAIETIQAISEITEDRQMYNQREKAQRDYEWTLAGAREEGREEGLEKGKLTGKVQMLQDLLGDSVSTDADLAKSDHEALNLQIHSLQSRMRSRDA